MVVQAALEMKINALVRAYRLNEEITLRSLAKEIGVPFTTLARWERGGKVHESILVKILIWLLKG